MSHTSEPTVNYVSHPPHYQTRAVECLEATRGTNTCLGNAIKYVYRAWDKGHLMQDLEKARFYLEDFMFHGECHRHPSSGLSRASLRKIAAGCTNDQEHERDFFYALADDLYGIALGALEAMIADNLEQD